MDPVLTTTVVIAGVGAVCGGALAAAARFLAVHEDPRIEKVAAILPGANCGGCGYAGCADYAKAIVTAGAEINLCAPGGPACVKKLATFLGLEATVTERKVALVLCGGSNSKTVRKFAYNGIADCAAAAAVGGGEKLCRYGCLGYGSCARVCPVGAIEIRDGLAVVHPEICIGCGKCVRACPRNLIKMVPESRTIHVLCSSKDKGPVVKKACEVGCIGCTICTKLADGAIAMQGFLAVVDYAKPLENDACVAKCPGHCIVRRPLNAPLETAAPAAAATPAPEGSAA